MTLHSRSIDGILPIDKPYGITSMDVVRQIKKVSGQKKVGHAGTLDPIATGVIPICIGQATRLTEFLIDSTKEYRGVFELGVETDTYDSFGKTSAVKSTSGITNKSINNILVNFLGRVQQVPPIYSALKQKGRRLYELARMGEDVIVESRFVEVFDIVLESYNEPFITVFVKCGKGFYMRSLAHDIGQALGVGANMKDLRRLRTGPFLLKNCYSLDDATKMLMDGTYSKVMYAPDSILEHLKAIVMDDQTIQLLRNGQAVSLKAGLPSGIDNELIKVYSSGGQFIALVKYKQSLKQWLPKKVFNLV